MTPPRTCSRTLSHRARWAVPAATAAVVAGAVLAGSVTTADAAPPLPARTAAQLLAAVSNASVPGLSGTVRTTAALGLPALGTVLGGAGGPATELTAGTHDLRVWTAGTDRQRVTIDDTLAEYSVVRRGGEVWAYDSRTGTVRHHGPGAAGAHPDAPEAGDTPDAVGTDGPLGVAGAGTPQEAAAAVLRGLDPTTAVRVDRTARVAGRPVYQLVLVPKDARSLVGSVRLAVDSATSLPLRVQVFARGRSAPAVQVGFTSLRLAVPAAGVFATPTGRPAPAATRPGTDAPSATVPDRPGTGPARPTGVTRVGSSWTTVVTARGVTLPTDVAPLVAAATTPLTVGGVTGRMFTSSLLSVLLLDDGRAFAGAVTPETLTALAAR